MLCGVSIASRLPSSKADMSKTWTSLVSTFPSTLGQHRDGIPPLTFPGSRHENHPPTQVLGACLPLFQKPGARRFRLSSLWYPRFTAPRQTPPPMTSGILSYFLRVAAVVSRFPLLVASVDLPLESPDFGRWIAEVERGEREFIWRWFIRPVVLSH